MDSGGERRVSINPEIRSALLLRVTRTDGGVAHCCHLQANVLNSKLDEWLVNVVTTVRKIKRDKNAKNTVEINDMLGGEKLFSFRVNTSTNN